MFKERSTKMSINILAPTLSTVKQQHKKKNDRLVLVSFFGEKQKKTVQLV